MKRCLKLILIFYFYQYFATLLCGGAYMLLNGTLKFPDASSPHYVTFIMTAQVVFSMFVIFHLILGKYVSLNRQTLAYYNSIKVVVSSIILVVGMGVWNNYLCELLELQNGMEELMGVMMTHPMGILSAVILAPIAEELLFRGAIQGYLLRNFGNPVWAISFSALLFGVVHGNLEQLFFASVLGLALGWVYYRTGSLVPSILMHFVNNALSVLSFHYMGDVDEVIAYLGLSTATLIAVLGVGITIACVIYMSKNLPIRAEKWYEDRNLESKV